MKFSEAIAEQARRFAAKADDDTFLDKAKPAVNMANLEVGKSWRWPLLKTIGSIIAIPVYSAGTCGITQDSNSVVMDTPGADAAAFAGRFWHKKGSGNTYRILSVSGSTLLLDQPVVEDSGSVEYEIEKKFYVLPTEVREIIGWDSGEDSVMGLDQAGLRQSRPGQGSGIADIPFDVAGADPFTEDYATGTISVAADTNVITSPDSPEWLKYVKPGNLMTFGSVNYRVKRVVSDTRLILYNKVKTAQTGVAYNISAQDALTVRPFVTFSTKKVVQFTYIRKTFDMVHDDDMTSFSTEADLAMLDFAEAFLMDSFQKAGWENKLAKAQARLSAAQALASPVRSSFKMFPPLIPRGMGRR